MAPSLSRPLQEECLGFIWKSIIATLEMPTQMFPPKGKVQAGMEFDYMRKYFVRFGYAEGWGSAGVGVRNKKFVFDLTTYAVEADETSDAFRQKEDRRYVLSLASGF